MKKKKEFRFIINFDCRFSWMFDSVKILTNLIAYRRVDTSIPKQRINSFINNLSINEIKFINLNIHKRDRLIE